MGLLTKSTIICAYFSNHAWVSFVGFAESYNELLKEESLALPDELKQLATKANGKK